jgi:hypothetical protein
MNDNQTVGGCGKHKGQPMINCPLCASEELTEKIRTDKSTKQEIQELLKDFNEEQMGDVLYFMVTIVAKRKKIHPTVLLNLVNNWELVEKLIYILK